MSAGFTVAACACGVSLALGMLGWRATCVLAAMGCVALVMVAALSRLALAALEAVRGRAGGSRARLDGFPSGDYRDAAASEVHYDVWRPSSSPRDIYTSASPPPALPAESDAEPRSPAIGHDGSARLHAHTTDPLPPAWNVARCRALPPLAGAPSAPAPRPFRSQFELSDSDAGAWTSDEEKDAEEAAAHPDVTCIDHVLDGATGILLVTRLAAAARKHEAFVAEHASLLTRRDALDAAAGADPAAKAAQRFQRNNIRYRLLYLEHILPVLSAVALRAGELDAADASAYAALYAAFADPAARQHEALCWTHEFRGSRIACKTFAAKAASSGASRVLRARASAGSVRASAGMPMRAATRHSLLRVRLASPTACAARVPLRAVSPKRPPRVGPLVTRR